MPDKKFISNKESCWQCYKLYSLDVETSEFKDGSKGFCSRKCFDKSNSINLTMCSLTMCKATFKKERGAFQIGKWFCSEEHGNQHPDSKKMLEINSKIMLGKPSDPALDD